MSGVFWVRTTVGALLSLGLIAGAGVSGCASARQSEVKSQAYAKLPNHRVFEYELPVVWKGIEGALKDYKITERDPKDMTTEELRKIDGFSLSTDWVYSQSRDKYQEYQVNDSPRKKYLQVRYKHEISVQRVMGGADVTVVSSEEIERLNSDGSSAGYYDEPKEVDSSLSNELLEKINLAILAAAP